MACGVCFKLGKNGKTRVEVITPPLNFYGKDVYLWQGACDTCGGQTAICLTCIEVKKRLSVGWYEKVVKKDD